VYTLYAMQWIQPVSVRGANRGWQYADALLVAQQIRADACNLRKLAGTKKFLLHE